MIIAKSGFDAIFAPLTASTPAATQASSISMAPKNPHLRMPMFVEKIYKVLQGTGAAMVGTYNTFPYKFEASEAVPITGGEALGLLIDDINHAGDTKETVAEWVKSLH